MLVRLGLQKHPKIAPPNDPKTNKKSTRNSNEKNIENRGQHGSKMPPKCPPKTIQKTNKKQDEKRTKKTSEKRANMDEKNLGMPQARRLEFARFPPCTPPEDPPRGMQRNSQPLSASSEPLSVT